MRLPALLAPFLFAVLVFAPAVRAADDLGPAIEPEALDALRGGYQLPGGLAVGFGLERLVAVNGEVVVAQRVDIPNIAAITPDQARQLAAITDGRTIQVGGATTITPGIGTVVIQNALDDQQIQALTGLHVDVNTLGLLQSMNFARSLDDALRLGATP
ncbi:MAG TPA: hypothetical protein VFE72_01430 [Lysobacter sp.]|nr:hypothetical protein [Lysobacter sp.]